MQTKIIQQYTAFVDFLGKVLGPDYEIALHEIDSENQSIIAIANGHVSGRKVGAPITELALKMIKDKVYESCDYILNYKGVSKSGKVLRSSTIFIKDENGGLVGMLCINFDDSRYLDISRRIFKLCHPDSADNENYPLFPMPDTFSGSVESFPDTISEVTEAVMKSSLSNGDIPADRLTQAEKLHIVDILNQKGIFLLKGAVSQVAKQLCCSEPTVYRYLSVLNNEKS